MGGLQLLMGGPRPETPDEAVTVRGDCHSEGGFPPWSRLAGPHIIHSIPGDEELRLSRFEVVAPEPAKGRDEVGGRPSNGEARIAGLDHVWVPVPAVPVG